MREPHILRESFFPRMREIPEKLGLTPPSRRSAPGFFNKLKTPRASRHPSPGSARKQRHTSASPTPAPLPSVAAPRISPCSARKARCSGLRSQTRSGCVLPPAAAQAASMPPAPPPPAPRPLAGYSRVRGRHRGGHGPSRPEAASTRPPQQSQNANTNFAGGRRPNAGNAQSPATAHCRGG